ncbi:polysaccharide biosynthesis/export family protein [Blastopirellula marina]|uniref:Polysaccharide export protein N-terminal domain-containing protein n=1 Tax=Blastopirellula marina TaxID=124 RepID=A0A2S8F9D7_9BACT|nr:polysaccharide biosynthesis/export family protein [Blastopirellula marina]PQO28752.1 hypothetical protein C5Y98_23510 [Blastopirellula marina]PTL42025.1 hypothetical protein C5Y97_23525 [Blastopirellula marina]
MKTHNYQFVALFTILTCSFMGCHTLSQPMDRYIDHPEHNAPVYTEQPKELQMVTMPDYVIEPPDLLSVQVVNLIPKAPYTLHPLDTIVVETTGLPEEQPVIGEYTIGIDGTVTLGFGYDEQTLGGTYRPLRIAGLTIPEAQAVIRERLAVHVQNPVVWVRLAGISAHQEISGEHLVAPDGTITLGGYGRVRVVGMTVDQAKSAVQSFLSDRFANPEVALDVYGYNSKVYYVVLQGAGLGDRVVPMPITGKDTALDALSQIDSLSSASSTRMWIARPGPNSQCGDQILPIDWQGITQRGDVATNYQLMPGDRVFVAENKLVAFDTALAKLISPIERVLGVTLLGTQTARTIHLYNQRNTGINNF